MTDIRKCAQAVIDVWDKLDNGKWETEGDFHTLDCQYREAFDTLRQALAEPVEPVAWLHHTCDPENGFCTDMRVSFSNHSILYEISREPLYTTPPSVDALIDELDSRLRYCAQSDSAIDAILDKYRSVK